MKLSHALKHFMLSTTILLHACSSMHMTPKSKPVVLPQKPEKTAKKVDEEKDGPPLVERDLSQVPDATPQIVPPSQYGNMPVYEVFGKHYRTMTESKGYEAKGIASWYGRKFHGRRTSSGETYDMFDMTAAHPHLPLPTWLHVKNLANGKEVIVKVNDRGPFERGRLIDLSYAAAKKLGIYETGTGKVHITAIDPIAWQKSNKSRLAKTDNTKHIYLQLGSFNQQANAKQLADKAEILASALTQANVHILQKEQLYKVRIGPLKTQAEAKTLQKKLITLKTTPTLIYE